MPYELPAACPICNEGLYVTRLKCKNCGSALKGEFELDRISRLTPSMRQFILEFLKCRGNIREMEKLFNISYPTVRARIDDIITRLGEQPSPDETAPTAAFRGREALISYAQTNDDTNEFSQANDDTIEYSHADDDIVDTPDAETAGRIDGAYVADSNTGCEEEENTGSDEKTGNDDIKISRREVLERLAKGEIGLEDAHKFLKDE